MAAPTANRLTSPRQTTRPPSRRSRNRRRGPRRSRWSTRPAEMQAGTETTLRHGRLTGGGLGIRRLLSPRRSPSSPALRPPHWAKGDNKSSPGALGRVPSGWRRVRASRDRRGGRLCRTPCQTSREDRDERRGAGCSADVKSVLKNADWRSTRGAVRVNGGQARQHLNHAAAIVGHCQASWSAPRRGSNGCNQ